MLGGPGKRASNIKSPLPKMIWYKYSNENRNIIHEIIKRKRKIDPKCSGHLLGWFYLRLEATADNNINITARPNTFET